MRSGTISVFSAVALWGSLSLAAVTLKVSKHSSHPTVRHKRLLTRENTLEGLFHNISTGGGFYQATVTVGTPPQDISLTIDTGSSDTWLISAGADICTDPEVQADVEGGCQTPFDPDKSSSFNIVSADTFHIQYADFTAADGDYISDDLSVGDITVKGVQMGLARTANNTEGLMGIGYQFIEASNDYDDPSTPGDDAFTYPNIIDAMVSQGIINIKAYSLYLDDLDSSSGSIIFGGMDTDKYRGDLIQMPIIPSTLRNGTEVYARLYVAMTNFKISSSTDGPNLNEVVSADDFEIPVLLDTGAAFSYLPTALVQFVVQAVNGVCDSDDCSGMVAVDCKLRTDSSDMTFDFHFGSESTIRVPVTEMIIPFDKLGWTIDESDGPLPFDETCVLGMIGDDESATLGDTFLRSAYVVYDLTNHLVGLAETNFDSEDSNVVDFEAGQTAIPNVSGTAAVPSITATGTKPGGDDGAFTATRTATSGRSTKTGSSNGSGTTSPTVTVTAPPGSAGVKSMQALNMTWLLVLGTSFGIAMISGGLFVMT